MNVQAFVYTLCVEAYVKHNRRGDSFKMPKELTATNRIFRDAM